MDGRKKNGGKRPGAGRKKGAATIEREKVKDYIAKKISEEIEPIVNKMIEKMKGGDVMATREMFDRAFGKPQQSVDVTSQGDKIHLSEFE